MSHVGAPLQVPHPLGNYFLPGDLELRLSSSATTATSIDKCDTRRRLLRRAAAIIEQRDRINARQPSNFGACSTAGSPRNIIPKTRPILR